MDFGEKGAVLYIPTYSTVLVEGGGQQKKRRDKKAKLNCTYHCHLILSCGLYLVGECARIAQICTDLVDRNEKFAFVPHYRWYSHT